MTDQADTQTASQEQTGSPSAGVQEHSIPKHRFDEALQRARQAEERERQKDQLLMQLAQQQRQPQQQQPQGLTAEQVGLDPETFQKMQAIIQHTVQNERKQFEGLIGQMANQQEVTNFLVNHGKDKGAYLPRIQEYQRDHMNRTGAFLPVDIAYKLIRADELEARSTQMQAAPVQRQQAPQYQAQAQDPYQTDNSYPGAQGTRMNTAPAMPPAGKSFAEMSVEEMEARLDGDFAKNGAI